MKTFTIIFLTLFTFLFSEIHNIVIENFQNHKGEFLQKRERYLIYDSLINQNK